MNTRMVNMSAQNQCMNVKNTEAESPLYKEMMSPETILKLFSHLNKHYLNKVKNKKV